MAVAFVKLYGPSLDVRTLIEEAQQQTEPGGYTSFEACIASWKQRLPHLVSSHCCPRGLSNFSWLQLLSARAGTYTLRQRDEEEEAWYSRARIALMLLYAIQYVFHRMHRLGATTPVAPSLTSLVHTHYLEQEQQQEQQHEQHDSERKKRKGRRDADTAARTTASATASTSEYTTVVPCYVSVCVLEAIEQLMESAADKRDDDVVAVAVEMLATGNSVDLTGPSRLCVGSVCAHHTRSRTRKSTACSADWIPASEIATTVVFGPVDRRQGGEGGGGPATLVSAASARGEQKKRGANMPVSTTRGDAPLNARERQLVSSLCTELNAVETHTAPSDVRSNRDEYTKLKRKKTITSGKISGINIDHRDGDAIHSKSARTSLKAMALQATEGNAAAADAAADAAAIAAITTAAGSGGNVDTAAQPSVDLEVELVKELVQKSLAQLTGAEEIDDVDVRGAKARRSEAINLFKMEDAILSKYRLLLDRSSIADLRDAEGVEQHNDTSDDEVSTDDDEVQRMPSISGLTSVQF